MLILNLKGMRWSETVLQFAEHSIRKFVFPCSFLPLEKSKLIDSCM